MLGLVLWKDAENFLEFSSSTTEHTEVSLEFIWFSYSMHYQNCGGFVISLQYVRQVLQVIFSHTRL